jgi:sugar phosphate isomerase/epimerase
VLDLPLAFSTLACPDWSLERAAEMAQTHGYAGIELRLLDGQTIEADIGPAARRRVRTVLEAAGLPAVALDTSVRLAGGDGAARELRSLLELAAEWGSPMVRVFGGDAPGGPAAMATVLEAAVPDAERLGVSIAVETHDALSSARAVADLLALVPSPAAGALWDVLHTWRMGEAPDLVARLFGDRLLHVHVKDGRPRGGADWELVPLGEGTVPMARSLRALRDGGYRGWLSVEWEKRWHPELAEPEVALPQHAAALAALR